MLGNYWGGEVLIRYSFRWSVGPEGDGWMDSGALEERYFHILRIEV